MNVNIYEWNTKHLVLQGEHNHTQQSIPHLQEQNFHLFRA